MNQPSILEEVVKKIKRNDALAMRWVYDQYAKEMLSSAFRITNDLMEAEDVIQESFINSFQKIKQLENPMHYKAWLKKMVINASLRMVKKNFKISSLGQLKELEQAQEEHHPWYTSIKFETIRAAVQELPKGCREILSLYLFEEYKHREIAELLGISISTSKSQYSYGLIKLKEKLKNSMHE